MVTPSGNSTLAFQVSLQTLDKRASFPTHQLQPGTEQHTAEGGDPEVTLRPDHARAEGAGVSQPRKGRRRKILLQVGLAFLAQQHATRGMLLAAMHLPFP